MSHRPVCVKCETEMWAHVNGTLVIDVIGALISEENPPGYYKLWEADTYKCPKCGMEIVIGFGQRCLLEHCEEGFSEGCDREIAAARKVVRNKER